MTQIQVKRTSRTTRDTTIDVRTPSGRLLPF